MRGENCPCVASRDPTMTHWAPAESERERVTGQWGSSEIRDVIARITNNADTAGRRPGEPSQCCSDSAYPVISYSQGWAWSLVTPGLQLGLFTSVKSVRLKHCSLPPSLPPSLTFNFSKEWREESHPQLFSLVAISVGTQPQPQPPQPPPPWNLSRLLLIARQLLP